MAFNEELPNKNESNKNDDSNSEKIVSKEEIREVVRSLKSRAEFKKYSAEQLKQVVEASVIEIIQESSFSGPLPHPSILAGYEKVLQGSSERIFAMAERNSSIRHNQENKIIDADLKRSAMGQILGFILSILFIGAAI